MAPVSVRDWFRTRRQLRATIDQQRNLLTERFNQLHDAAKGLNEYAATMDGRFERLRKSHLRVAREKRAEVEAHDATKRLLASAETKLVRLVEELTLLREDIRRAEEIDHPPTVGGTGMVRPLAQRNPMADRILRRPWPADLADVLAQETVAKRLSDGEGDE